MFFNDKPGVTAFKLCDFKFEEKFMLKRMVGNELYGRFALLRAIQLSD